MPVRRRGARGGSKRDSGAAGDRSVAGLKPNINEVLNAIESLYFDQLKPLGRILRKRIAENYAPEEPLGSRLPEIDVLHLHQTCLSCPSLHVQPEEAGDWSAVFVGRPQNFVDIFSRQDPFPETCWMQAAAYFGSLPPHDMQLPGGRYTCAQLLMERDLAFIRGMTLGQVCLFVELGISQRKVLGYSEGSVVPYAHSTSKVKEQRAISHQTAADVGEQCCDGVPGPVTVATWPTARSCLRELLQGAGGCRREPAAVAMSNLKRLLRTHFAVELSETALGHSKLSELLQDQRFADICRVELRGNGYTVVQNQETCSFVNALWQPVQPLDLDEDSDEEMPPSRLPMFGLGAELALASPRTPSNGLLSIATPMYSPGVPPSWTRGAWAGKFTSEAPVGHPLRDVAEAPQRSGPAQADYECMPLLSPGASPWPLPRPPLATDGSTVAEEAFLPEAVTQRWKIQNTFVHVATVPLTPVTRPRSCSCVEAYMCSSPVELPMLSNQTSYSLQSMCCAADGSISEECSPQGRSLRSTAASPSSTMRKVQNTFIHSAPLPQTPLGRRRAYSCGAPAEIEKAEMYTCSFSVEAPTSSSLLASLRGDDYDSACSTADGRVSEKGSSEDARSRRSSLSSVACTDQPVHIESEPHKVFVPALPRFDCSALALDDMQGESAVVAGSPLVRRLATPLH